MHGPLNVKSINNLSLRLSTDCWIMNLKIPDPKMPRLLRNLMRGVLVINYNFVFSLVYISPNALRFNVVVIEDVRNGILINSFILS